MAGGASPIYRPQYSVGKKGASVCDARFRTQRGLPIKAAYSGSLQYRNPRTWVGEPLRLFYGCFGSDTVRPIGEHRVRTPCWSNKLNDWTTSIRPLSLSERLPTLTISPSRSLYNFSFFHLSVSFVASCPKKESCTVCTSRWALRSRAVQGVLP